MYKEIIIKILNNTQITENELSEFILEYVKEEKNIELSGNQLLNIKALIKRGQFNLYYAAKMAATKFKELTVVAVQDLNTGQILKTICY